MGGGDGHLSEFSASAAAFERAAEAAEDPGTRAFQLGSAAQSHLWAHPYAECARTNDAAHELAVRKENRAVEAITTSLRGQYGAILEADLDTADDLCKRAYELAHGELGEIASRLGRRADEERHRARAAELAQRAAASLTDSELRARLLASASLPEHGRRSSP